MTLQHLKEVAKAELKKLTTWGKITLLAALPWAGEIHDTLESSLPSLAPYLPENIYKFMGGAVVAAGIVMGIWRSHQAVKAQQ